MKTLDRSKPYGEVKGGEDNPHSYEQDGHCFDVNGDEVVVGKQKPAPSAPADNQDDDTDNLPGALATKAKPKAKPRSKRRAVAKKPATSSK